MKNLLKIVTAIGVVFALAVSAAAADCVPQPPKDLEGKFQGVGPVRKSIAATYFEQNSCDWSGNDQLNGTDAYVFDIEGMDGPATIKAVVQAGVAAAFEGIVFDSNCTRLDPPLTFAAQGPATAEPYVVNLPVSGKWLIVEAGSTNPVSGSAQVDVSISLHWDGRVCTPVKHKKKRRR